MNTSIKIPTVLTTSVINLLNYLIHNKSINIKKLYSFDNTILEKDNLEIKNIYCKNRTAKGTICLNKCIDNSKYCRIHDPIMKEQKKINRLNMNIKRKLINQEIKLFRKIEYEIGNEYLPSEDSHEKIEHNYIINRSIESISPSCRYDQKPEKYNKKNINEIKINNYNSNFIESVINETDNCLKNFDLFYRYKPTYIINYINKGINNKLTKEEKNLLDQILANKYVNNKEVAIPTVEEYKEKLNNIDYSILSKYKGNRLHKLVDNVINIQIRSYYIKAPNLYNDTTLSIISNILERIPK
jgi:hypothetical protein